ncbi:hypothetical protein Q4595_11510 [Wenyingzhuangia sp. 1_MG-2023]|nr:hypothetical protein [Wenyingzhuangia sp. 1_MG-2023]
MIILKSKLPENIFTLKITSKNLSLNENILNVERIAVANHLLNNKPKVKELPQNESIFNFETLKTLLRFMNSINSLKIIKK